MIVPLEHIPLLNKLQTFQHVPIVDMGITVFLQDSLLVACVIQEPLEMIPLEDYIVFYVILGLIHLVIRSLRVYPVQVVVIFHLLDLLTVQDVEWVDIPL